MGVGSDGGAQTLAVTALVAGARVIDAALHVLGVVLHRVTGREQVGGQDAALLLGPRSSLGYPQARVSYLQVHVYRYRYIYLLRMLHCFWAHGLRWGTLRHGSATCRYMCIGTGTLIY